MPPRSRDHTPAEAAAEAAAEASVEAAAEAARVILVTFNSQSSALRPVTFKGRRTLSMAHFMHAYCKKYGLEFAVQRFMHDGQRVKSTTKAAELCEHNDGTIIVDACMERAGG
jgi:isopropylmalate/homocitrate/citramalate synthase